MNGSSTPALHVTDLGRVDYEPTWRRMQRFTDGRNPGTADELWLVEHPPVFTLGQNGRREHLLHPDDIPVIDVDRGGQVTYHGPGQVVAYPLVDLRRRRIGVRRMVSVLEETVISLLADLGISARARSDAPGVYVDDAKIAALGLRVRRGCSYHGLAFNVDMDLEPFQRINPCGYAGLPVVDLASLGVSITPEEARRLVAERLTDTLAEASRIRVPATHD
ncbi:MAG TPA: lipoyl(octanoyl) transferase LipB [Gammaproteobacteria bacterium]|nr:lipoyl(octanoyl) transferase LipB [Gammaproteobacteria bacterium]